MIVTIDGPAASGKSTVARMVAEALHFYYLNTGLLYRAVTYILLTTYQYSQKDLSAVSAQVLQDCIDPQRLLYSYDPLNGSTVMYDGVDITSFLKDPMIDQSVSVISPQKIVRENLSELQRAIAKKHDVIVEGRDVGSVVFPHADYKFYLTASLEVRAQRWKTYQESKGKLLSLKQALELIADRDARDKGREISPLVVPQNATVIDNSELTLDQTLQVFLAYIRN